jgi:hypothetical protein
MAADADAAAPMIALNAGPARKPAWAEWLKWLALLALAAASAALAFYFLPDGLFRR